MCSGGDKHLETHSFPRRKYWHRIGVLAPDTDVEYLRDYDEKWAVISYNGQEAYVSRDFIRQVSQ